MLSGVEECSRQSKSFNKSTVFDYVMLSGVEA
jgi:hypothetical protein